MGDGRWAMGDGRWAMGDGRWAMGDGRWAMGDGRWANQIVCKSLTLSSSCSCFALAIFFYPRRLPIAYGLAVIFFL
ncbi:hypothetical protein [Photobacterium rosenbergii]|uniref:hypothetical protein n=1 Tax=Photobacterium rosenbergii TaxID=294936 RepID=UPI001C999F17|nr:hypothetical protein [Photobacterium rosenbergii]MBY5945292.1 hypothetical protein [Photobacterium rosenbergii]